MEHADQAFEHTQQEIGEVLEHLSEIDGDELREVTERVLHGVSFDIGAGRIVGVLGRSGSGKTTLARLLTRLYDPGTGEVRIRVESTAPWHVSTEAPAMLALEAPPGVTFAPAELRREDATTLDDDVLEFRTAYRCDPPEANASGRLKLGICQGDLCVIVREELDIPVRAH